MSQVKAYGPIYPRVPSYVVFFVGAVVGMALLMFAVGLR